MRIEDFPKDIRNFLLPRPVPTCFMHYRCLRCGKDFSVGKSLYTCPECGGILMLECDPLERFKAFTPDRWRRLFEGRRMLASTEYPSLKGVFGFYELVAPVIPLESIVYLGEGWTPMVKAAPGLERLVGRRFWFKNDGQNPSASFKDRGMASAFSFANALFFWRKIQRMLAICASTGDTSASDALFAAYLEAQLGSELVQSAVLLPKGLVTPQQIAQALAAGAKVFELPGKFDDCMKLVEYLANHYQVMLLNSKNPWRILGQKTFAYEIAMDFNWKLDNVAVVLPIGNAGNITAVLSGFLDLYRLGIIGRLPKIIGVQSAHADPVYQYYMEPDERKAVFKPQVNVGPSVAQAAMIGNPVSMPRVIDLVKAYNQAFGGKGVFFVQVSEQEIMDFCKRANRAGHPVCTQGGESLAGLYVASMTGVVGAGEQAVVNSTAHMIKFTGFLEKYDRADFSADFRIVPKRELQNRPLIMDQLDSYFPEPGCPGHKEKYAAYVERAASEIARNLNLI